MGIGDLVMLGYGAVKVTEAVRAEWEAIDAHLGPAVTSPKEVKSHYTEAPKISAASAMPIPPPFVPPPVPPPTLRLVPPPPVKPIAPPAPWGALIGWGATFLFAQGDSTPSNNPNWQPLGPTIQEAMRQIQIASGEHPAPVGTSDEGEGKHTKDVASTTTGESSSARSRQAKENAVATTIERCRSLTSNTGVSLQDLQEALKEAFSELWMTAGIANAYFDEPDRFPCPPFYKFQGDQVDVDLCHKLAAFGRLSLRLKKTRPSVQEMNDLFSAWHQKVCVEDEGFSLEARVLGRLLQHFGMLE